MALQGKSIRTISDAEFGAIALAGFAETLVPARTHRPEHGESQVDMTLQGLVGVPQEEAGAAHRPDVGQPAAQRCGVPHLRGEGIRGNVRRDSTAVRERRGQDRGAGSAHLEREGRRAGHRPERHRALGEPALTTHCTEMVLNTTVIRELVTGSKRGSRGCREWVGCAQKCAQLSLAGAGVG